MQLPRLRLACVSAACLLACSAPDIETKAARDGTAPAVMVALTTRSPEGSSFYVGAYPTLPDTVELSTMLETPSGQNAAAFDGSLFVWSAESGVYTRYAVDDAFQLSKSGEVSFANEAGTGNVMTRFISKTRAYSMTRDNLRIVVWDPEQMAVLGSIDTSAVIDPEYPSYDYGEPVQFGDYVAWPILFYDYDNFDFKPSVDVILTSARDEEPAFLVSDRRCGGGWSLFTDEQGDLYALGNAWFGFAHFFDRDPERQPHDCLLRIRSGSTAFDPEFHVDLNRAAASPAVYHTWHASGRSVVAAVWDSAIDPRSLPSPDDYWTTPMKRKLVLIDDESSRTLEGIPDSSVFSTLDYRLDDELYLLMSEGSAERVSSVLYRVNQGRAEPTLRTPGNIWAIGRIR